MSENDKSVMAAMLKRRTFLASSFAAVAAAGLPRDAFGANLAPFKLYDTHAHFYSDDAVKYPFRADVTPQALAKAKAHPMTPDAIFKMWREVGVEIGCGVQYNTTYSTDNRYLLDCAAKYPRRITSIVILSATDPATPATLARMAKDDDICGVRFTGFADEAGGYSFLSEAAAPSWAAANDLGLVIVLMPVPGQRRYAQPPAMKRIGELAARYPNVHVVLDHIGFPTPENTPTFGLSPEHLALAAHKNIYYKYTTYLIEIQQKGGVPLKDFLNYAVGVYGADHFVWGSDVGNTEGDFAHFVQLALGAAEDLPLTQKKAVFYTTAKKIFVPGGRGPARHKK
jgi:predicted TIM-barrel fold metal-dependent hydrolase